MDTHRSPLDVTLARRMLATAYDEALDGAHEGGIPIGAGTVRVSFDSSTSARS